jgi:MFS superfamily sulfate permease-like transporter
MKRLWRVSRYEFAVSMIAFAAVLLLGILDGVIVAVLASLTLLIGRVARPHVAVLGRIPGSRKFSDIGRNPGNTRVPGVLIVRVDAGLLYFNVDHVYDAVRGMVRSAPDKPKLVICDLSTSPQVDLAAAKMLTKLHQELAQAGIRLRLVAAHAPVRDILRAEGLEERLGYFGRRISVADAIDEFDGTNPAAPVPA